MFRLENVETEFDQAHELSEFSGLSPFDIVVFRPQRLIVHGLLIRVTTMLSVPDGPDYEELGINLRGMVERLYRIHFAPRQEEFETIFEQVRKEAGDRIAFHLSQLQPPSRAPPGPTKTGLLDRILRRKQKAQSASSGDPGHRVAALETLASRKDGSLDTVCCKSLVTVTNSIIGQRGRLVGDADTIVGLATGLVLNDWAGLRLGDAITPLFEEAARKEGFRFLPSQKKPFIMNVKGASASGKSTIRPKQRELAQRLGIAWEDFALISPDYWRKYLLDYDSLGEHAKYGAMLTGHELAIIDRKLDRQMAQRGEKDQIPHLLIDRFRFDSFSVGDDRSSQLLTRFGDTVFMFYMITPPQETVERAYRRGLTTGRYKAVDDLLDHNIEAYTGMPALFFSWALSEKKVHHEFLDNDVEQDAPPRTVAFGWNGILNILDVSKMLDIDRYKQIDVDARGPDEVYLKGRMAAEDNGEFLAQCARMIAVLRFVDWETGRIYGRMEKGSWKMRDEEYVAQSIDDPDTLAGLRLLGWWDASETADCARPEFLDPLAADCNTLGRWAPGFAPQR